MYTKTPNVTATSKPDCEPNLTKYKLTPLSVLNAVKIITFLAVADRNHNLLIGAPHVMVSIIIVKIVQFKFALKQFNHQIN